MHLRSPRHIALIALFLIHTPAPVLHADWRSEADARIEKFRKGDFVVDLKTPVPPGTMVQVHQTRSDFLFGVAVAESLLTGTSGDAAKYREFIIDHFNALVPENSMKWYAMEKDRDTFTFGPADALCAFAREQGMPLRGHCLFWSKTKFVQPWVQALDNPALGKAVDAHLKQMVYRYKKEVICWDVDNEMLDGAFYQDRLGPEIRASMFRQAHDLAPDTPLFVNEYGILDSDDKMNRYMDLIRHLQSQGAPVGGIGIQEHAAERFVPQSSGGPDENPERAGLAPLIPEDIWKRLDTLSQFGLPIHLTEISAKTSDPERRAESLEMLYRVGFAHPNVDAIFLWGFWEKAHWLGKPAALVDKDWNVLPAGERLSHLLKKEWQTRAIVPVGPDGKLNFRGFYGTYELSWTQPGAGPRKMIFIAQSPHHPSIPDPHLPSSRDAK